MMLNDLDNPYSSLVDDEPEEPSWALVAAVTLLAIGVASVGVFVSYLVPYVLLLANVLSFGVAFGTFVLLALTSVIVPFVLAGWLLRRITGHGPGVESADSADVRTPEATDPLWTADPDAQPDFRL